MEQFVLIQLLTLYFAILLHLQAFPMTYEVLWSSDISKSESWGKTTEGQKGSKTKKALFSKKKFSCKFSALCLNKRQNKKKGGWMEGHTKKEYSRRQQLYPSPPASPVCTANSPTWITWLHSFGRTWRETAASSTQPISDVCLQVTAFFQWQSMAGLLWHQEFCADVWT